MTKTTIGKPINLPCRVDMIGLMSAQTGRGKTFRKKKISKIDITMDLATYYYIFGGGRCVSSLSLTKTVFKCTSFGCLKNITSILKHNQRLCRVFFQFLILKTQKDRLCWEKKLGKACNVSRPLHDNDPMNPIEL